MKKTLLSLTVLVMFFGMSMPNVNAQGPINSELHFDTMDEFNEALNNGMFSESSDDDIVSPTALSAGIAVFAGGILVGFIVDGVIIYSTGFSAGQWVAIGISYASCKAKKKTFYLDRYTGSTACYGGAGVVW